MGSRAGQRKTAVVITKSLWFPISPVQSSILNDEVLVVSHLTRAKQYPERARRRGLQGDVVIDLVLDRDGSVRRSMIVGNSPWEILDLEALHMVERAAPFPAPPPNYRPGEAVNFKIPIRFELH